MAIRTLAASEEVVLSSENEVVHPLAIHLRVFLPRIGDGTGGTVAPGAKILFASEAEGTLEICDNMRRRVTMMPSRSARMLIAKSTMDWTETQAPQTYPAARVTDLPEGGGTSDPATTLVLGLTKVDHNSAGSPIALTQTGHGAAADPHPQYAVDVHGHAIADVTNLQATLDGKAASSHTHNASDIDAGTLNEARLPVATAAARGGVKVDHASAGNPIALTQSGHEAAADPHPQYALDSEKGANLGLATLDGSGKLTALQLPLGTTGTTAAAGNDSRLSDARTPTAHTHAISDTTGLQAALDAKQAAASALTMATVIDTLYPVGSLYTSTLSTNPATLLGRGTWVAFAAGRVLVGVDGSDPDFDVSGDTGGAKTVAAAGTVSAPTFTGTSNQATSLVSAGTPAGTNGAPAFTGTPATLTGSVSAPTFTGSALATHTHELPFQHVAGGTGVLRMLAPTIFGTGTSRAAEAQSAAPTANTTAAAVLLSEAKSAGTPAGTNSVPTLSMNSYTPQGTVAAPVFTGSALATHSHTLTPAGTVSAPTFTGSATSVVQPYIAVHMWKRTA